MNNFGKKLLSYFLYCGLTKEQYKGVKKEAYKTNFRVWKIVHFILLGLSLILLCMELPNADKNVVNYDIMSYGAMAIYCLIVSFLFWFVFKEDSLIAQFVIYLSIIVALLLALLLNYDHKDMQAVTFVVMLIALPMLMIDKPYFMSIVIIISCTIFILSSYYVKGELYPEAFRGDLLNCIFYGFMGILINCFYNSLIVKQFLLAKELQIKSDTDELTGLKNKSALIKSIDSYLVINNSAIMFSMDIDNFKKLNDKYGHAFGDDALREFGNYFKDNYQEEAIAGRFGGDEFIALFKTDDLDKCIEYANNIIWYVNNNIKAPDNSKLGISIGIACAYGNEEKYDDLFRKADAALYEAKDSGKNTYKVYKG